MSQEPLRILHLTAASDAGGLSRYLLDICGGLMKNGHQPTIAGGRGAWHERFVRCPWPWIEVSMTGGYFALRDAADLLRRHLEKHPTDLIHTHYRRPTLVARRATRGMKIPILYTVHQPRIRLAGPWRWLSDFGDHTHCPSADARAWLIDEARIASETITVIPHGVDAEKYPRRDREVQAAARRKLELPAEATVAAFVGRLDVPKNEEWMLDVAEANPSAIILIAGDGPHEEAMRRAVSSRNLSSRVRMLGECDPLAVYQACDGLFSPSEREGFSLVCAEAMCVGAPVLRTRTGGAAEMIIEGKTGRTTPVNRGEFAAASKEFLRDREALYQMGEAAAEHIRANFTLGQQIDRTIALYHKLTRKG